MSRYRKLRGWLGTAAALLLTTLQVQAGTFTAQNDLYSVISGTCLNYIDVEANDGVDSLGTPQLQIVSQPDNGQANLNGRYFSYCPTPGFIGTDNFTYTITVNSETDTASVYINVVPFNSFIYPGDADQNGVVQQYDVLSIGLASGLTGPARIDSNAANALSWQPSAYLNTNPGAADCNGDGIVDVSDLAMVAFNYGDTFSFLPVKEVDTSLCTGYGIPAYLVSVQGDSVQDGDTLDLDIYLGDANHLNDAYGLAFTLQFDNSFINADAATFNTSNSWLLQNTTGLFFNRNKQLSGELDIALTRNDHQHQTGGGPALRARLPIDDNIDGIIHAPGWHNLQVQLKGIKVVNNVGIVRDVCSQQTNLAVFKNATDVHEPEAVYTRIYPNPAKDWLTITGEQLQGIALLEITGRELYSAPLSGSNIFNIDLSVLRLPPGTYLLQLATGWGTAVHKLIIKP